MSQYSSSRGSRTKERVETVLFLIKNPCRTLAVTFSLTTIPIIYNFVVFENPIGLSPMVPLLHVISTCLLISGACINPFLYALYGQKIRRAVLVVLGQIRFRSGRKKMQAKVIVNKEPDIKSNLTGRQNSCLIFLIYLVQTEVRCCSKSSASVSAC